MAEGLEAEVAAARADTRRVFGPFLLLGELGKGGMGVVYRAWDERLRRVVAIKTLLDPDATSVQRFEREAQALAKLRHPGIVGVHGVGNVAGRHYLAMDFVEGAPLANLVGPRASGRLPLTHALEVVRDVARAVHAAHEQGVIHRDLKPANVIVEPSGRAVVLDFGLAKVRGAANLTRSGATMGTPAFMAPEQVGDQGDADARTDVYALGAILYNVLTGRPPFVGPSEINIITALVNRDPVPPSELNARAAGDLETICLRCLEKDPSRRYATARDVAAEIERHLSGEPIEARPIGPLERWSRRVRRNKLVTALAVLAGSALLALASIGVRAAVLRARADEERRAQERAEAAANAAKLADERRLTREKTATIFAERAARSLEKGRHREAAMEAAESLACLEGSAARASYFAARQGPHGKPRVIVPPSPASPCSLAISPDRSLLALGRTDGSIVLRSLPGGEDRGTIPGLTEGARLAWRPGVDRHELLVASGRSVLLWRETTGRLEPLADLPGPCPCAWDPSGDRILAWNGDELSAFDVKSRERRTIASGLGMGLYGASESPDGALIAIWGTNYKVEVVDQKGQHFATLAGPFGGTVKQVAWAPRGSGRLQRFATSAYDGRVRVWEIGQTGTIYEVSLFAAGNSEEGSIAWSLSADRLLTAWDDGLARIWDARSERLSVLELDSASPIFLVAWVSDDLAALAARDGSVTLVETRGREDVVTRAETREVESVAWSRDGRLATAGRTWSLVIDGPDRRWDLGNWILSTDWSPAGDRVAAAVCSRPKGLGHVYAFDPSRPGTDGTVAAFAHDEREEWGTRVAWSPDGKWLAGGWGAPWAPPGSFWISIDDPAAGPAAERIHLERYITGLRWLRGTLVVSTTDGFVRAFEPATRRELASVKLGESVTALACSPDGKLVAAAVGRETRLLDPSLATVGVLAAHEREVAAIAFDPPGKRIATAAVDRTLKVHALGGAHELLQTIQLDGTPNAAAYHPDGQRIAISFKDQGGVVQVWPLDEILGGTPRERILAEAKAETGLEVDPEVKRVLHD